MYIGFHVEYLYSCPNLMKILIFSTDFRKILKYQI